MRRTNYQKDRNKERTKNKKKMIGYDLLRFILFNHFL